MTFAQKKVYDKLKNNKNTTQTEQFQNLIAKS